VDRLRGVRPRPPRHRPATHAIDLLFRIGDYCLDFDLVYEALNRLRVARERPQQSPYLDWVEVRRAYIDDPEVAHDAASRFFKWSETGSTDRLMAVVRLIGQGVVRGVAGDPDVMTGMDALTEFSESSQPQFRASALSNIGVWHLDRRRLSEAEAALGYAIRSVRDLSGTQPGMILSNWMEIYIQMGEPERAIAIAARPEFSQTRSTPIDQMAVDACRALLELESGRLSAAAGLLDRWQHVPIGSPFSFFPETLAIARTRVHRAMGDRDDPNVELLQLIARAEKMGMPDRAARLSRELR